MADQKYNVEIDFTLGAQSKAKLESEIAEVKKKAAEKQPMVQPTTGPGSAWKDEYADAAAEMDKLGATQKKVWEAGKKASKEYAKVVGDSTKSVEELYTSVIKTAGAEDLQAQALKEMRQRASALRAESSVLRRSAADLEFFSRAALVSGTALIAGVMTYANKYVSEADHATAVTVKWKAAQDDLHTSSQRIGEVFAREALPFLEKAASFMREAASFIEAHPGIVPAAVNAGAILIGIGVIGKAVSTGIRLTADALTIQSAYIRWQAATIDDVSADKYLLAAEMNAATANKEVGSTAFGAGSKGTLGGLATALGEVVVLLGSFAAGLIAGDRIFDAIEKRNMKFADYVVEAKQALAIDAKNLGDFLSKSGLFTTIGGTKPFSQDLGMKWFEKVADALGLLKKKADDAAVALDGVDLGSVENSPAKEQIINAYEDMLKDEADLQRKYTSDRLKITQDALHDELDANRKYADGVAKINSNLVSSLAKLASDFAKANSDAEAKYNEQRNQILTDQADDLAKIQADLQEKLAKLARDNKDRESELIAQRDALGLVKQQRKYQVDRQQAIRDAAKESADRRAETAKRLADLQQSFEQEREQRAADYASRVAELRQNAAEQLKELQAQHTEELNRIRQQRADRLRELDAQFKAERDRRYQYFIAQIRDLDATLLGEKKLRDARQAEMLADLDAWLVRYRQHMATGLNSLNVAPTKDTGGYVTKGLYRMAWDGNREFVMSGPTTKAAERALGSQLSQAGLLRLLGGGQSQANYYDNRRMEVPISKDQKELYRKAAVEALQQIIGN